MSMGAGGGTEVVRGGGRKRRRRRPVSDINITPMVDVMLVLLVIFIVTAPSMTKEGVDVDLPRAHGSSGAGNTPTVLTIVIDTAGKIYVGPKTIEPADIETELPALVKGHENDTVSIKGDLNARLGAAVKVLATLRAAGVSKVVFAVSGGK
jgi:biopolymer transport protein TolR